MQGGWSMPQQAAVSVTCKSSPAGSASPGHTEGMLGAVGSLGFPLSWGKPPAVLVQPVSSAADEACPRQVKTPWLTTRMRGTSIPWLGC